MSPRISRRVFIGSGFGVVVTAGLTAISSPPTFAGPRNAITIAAGAGRPITFFDGTFSTLFALDVPTEIEIKGAWTENLLVAIRFDPRVLTLGDLAILRRGDAVSVASVVTGEGTGDFVIPLDKTLGAVPSRSPIIVGLTLQGRDLYPGDNLDGVAAIGFTVSNSSALAELEVAPRVLDSAVRPYGAEISARWSEVEIPGGLVTKYPYPYSVILTSTGPHSIPPGSQIAIHVDERVVTVDEVEQAIFGSIGDAADAAKRTLASTTYRDAGYAILVAELDQAVAADDSIELVLRNSVLAGASAAGLLPSYVSVATNAGAADWQRQTGRLTTSKPPNRG